MLEVNIRSAGYEIGEKTIHDIAFSIKKGELVALIGQLRYILLFRHLYLWESIIVPYGQMNYQ